jgi:hypothetical protein
MELSKYQNPHDESTTLPIAIGTKTLVDPLFAVRKEGVSVIIKFSTIKFPLYAKGEERVVERSKDRVSKIYERKLSSLSNRLQYGA